MMSEGRHEESQRRRDRKKQQQGFPLFHVERELLPQATRGQVTFDQIAVSVFVLFFSKDF